jgi:hypothetical protein
MSRVKSIEEQLLESIGHKPRITEEGQILRVSGEEGSPEAKEFISKIETMYKKQFPKGMFNAGVRKSIGSPYISIEIGIIPREKQAHNIAMNDDGYHAFMMSLMNDGSMPEKLSIDANQGGSLKVKPEKGSHYAMGSVKFGWKKKSGTLDQVLKHMDLYFKKMRSVVDANLENIYGGSEFIESLREDSDDAYRAKVDGLRKRVSELHTSVKNLTDKIQAMVAKNKGMKHDDPKWDAAREKMNAMEGKRSDQRAKIEELGAKIDKEIEKHKKAKKESVKESDLPTDVIAKIKANNDKMTDLKKNGGSQEEIDALEKENDELNGGNKTFGESAGKAFFGTVGQFNYAVKINGFDPDDLSGNGSDSLKAMTVVRDFQKKAERTYISSKGKANMGVIKKWVKEYGPSQFAVKWPAGNWNDDNVEMFYIGELD